ncbi:hypothetical protein ED236_01600 [Pseudomethylobacillus aquaticus]|uniref:Transporter n=1 Tax=Pseudomethylobacillus aquaticus TaxID=2676064 RepID=A0A3N0V657_9PROT|nr:hypothetical protein [Pseudomethylobacillus aquaticus]ROH88193.1 hypothetical protein ED236_01600 [Pseudomethylobacillus aquaticus]
MLRSLFFSIALLLSASAHAARPFVTDDARLTRAGGCQLESWTRLYSNSSELWALPACNPGGNLEVTLGTGLSRQHGAGTTADYVLQLKTLFRELQPNGWGIGIAAGVISHPEASPGPNQLGNRYLYIPYSASFMDDALVIHLNLGVLRDRETDRHSATWGSGAELALTPRLSGVAEMYGDDRGGRFYQTGLRYSVIPQLLQLDSTVGQRVDGMRDDAWLSFGLRYTP